MKAPAAALIALAIVAPLVLASETLAPEWTFTLTGYPGWVSTARDGTVFAYDLDGYFYIINSKGRLVALSHVGQLAKTSADTPVIASPAAGDYAVYAIDGVSGQVYTAVSSSGSVEWSFYVPGKTVAFAVSPEGDAVAVAYRSPQPPVGEIKLILAVYEGGSLVYNVPVAMVGIAEAASVRVAVSDDGAAAVFLPSPGEIRVYSAEGRLAWTKSQRTVPQVMCLSEHDTLVVLYRSGQGLVAETSGPAGEIASATYNALFYAVSPDCRYMAYYDRNSTLWLANLATGESSKISVLGRISALDVSENGEYILAAGGYSYYLYGRRGVLVGSGFTLSPAQKSVLSAGGGVGVVVDSDARIYYFTNPEAQRLELTLRLLALGVVFVAGLILLLRASRRKPQVEEHDEEIFPE